MAKEPARLIDDPTVSAALRSDVELASAEHHAYADGYDAAAKVAALQAALAGMLVASSAAATAGAGASGSASATGAAAQLGWVAKTVLGIVSASALVLSGAGLHAAWQAREQRASASAAQTRAAPPRPLVAPSVVPLPSPAPPALEPPARAVDAPASQSVSESRASGSRERPAATANEARQLARIRALLQAGAADKALRLAERGQRELGESILWQEREALAVLALLQLDRDAQAEMRARALLNRYPDSPFGAEIDQRLRRADED